MKAGVLEYVEQQSRMEQPVPVTVGGREETG